MKSFFYFNVLLSLYVSIMANAFAQSKKIKQCKQIKASYNKAVDREFSIKNCLEITEGKSLCLKHYKDQRAKFRWTQNSSHYSLVNELNKESIPVHNLLNKLLDKANNLHCFSLDLRNLRPKKQFKKFKKSPNLSRNKARR